MPPQPEHQQMEKEITLDAEITITARVPAKVTLQRQTDHPFSLPAQTIELQLNPQATIILKYYN